jgi:plastocyanin
VCGPQPPLVRVDARGRVAGAIVFLKTAPPSRVRSPATVVFDQIGCAFVPHVAGAVAGTQVRFRTSDPVLHNVHAIDERGQTLANLAMPVQGQEAAAFTAKAPGIVRLRCDAGHGWMAAWLRVFPHGAWTTTDARGGYRIDGIPPGAHRIVAWHPEIGEVERTLEVRAAGSEARLDVVF